MRSGVVKGKTLEGEAQVSFFVSYTVAELGQRFSDKTKDVPGLAKEVAGRIVEEVDKFQANPHEVI